jgi:Rrf2 family iron-sulfur cluster assembly transcriptional regulator
VELNTKARYAVMAMADLAKHGDEGAVPLSAIAERQNLSLAYLEQIFLRLRRAGLVASARGRAGGYVLVRPAPEIPVAAILTAVEEETRMTRCLDGDVGCLGDHRCLTHGLWHALGGHIAAFLANVSLQEVLDGIPVAKLAAQSAREREHASPAQEVAAAR